MWIPVVFWWKNTSRSAVPGHPRSTSHFWSPRCITLFEGLQIGSSLILLKKSGTRETCGNNRDEKTYPTSKHCAHVSNWGTPRPQALHLKPLKPQLPSCFDGRLFGGKCLLTKIHESIVRWSNHGKSMEIPTADGEICMSLLVTSSSMTMCIFILKSPKKMTHYGLVNSPVFLCFLIPRFPFAQPTWLRIPAKTTQEYGFLGAGSY